MARGAEAREARRLDASPTMTPPDSTRDGLTRTAGIVGLATMTSRVLGLVRDQALAYRFGAGDRMDAFFVALRIPNLLRELFAEGAMNAAFVPVFTRAPDPRGPQGGVAAGGPAHQRPRGRHRGHRGRRHRLRRAPDPPVRRRLPRRPRQARADRAVDPHRPALLHPGGDRRRVHGHAQLAAAFLRPRALARRLQRLPHRGRPRRRAPDARGRRRPHRGGRGGGAGRRCGADRGAVVGAAPRGVPLAAGPGPGRPGPARGRGADGAGDGGGGRAAGEPARQHPPRHLRGHRRGQLAYPRFPADVPAAGGARGVDSDGDPARGVPARRGRRPRGGAGDRVARAAPDARGDGAGGGGPHGPRNPHRAARLGARRVLRRRHHGDGARAGVLRPGHRRLRCGAADRPGVLRLREQPGPGRGQRWRRRRERRG